MTRDREDFWILTECGLEVTSRIIKWPIIAIVFIIASPFWLIGEIQDRIQRARIERREAESKETSV